MMVASQHHSQWFSDSDARYVIKEQEKEKTNMISITTMMGTLTNIIMMIMTAFLEVSRH